MNLYVAIVIRGEGGFLTVYHSKKKEHPWRFPGGKIEPGELAIVAAARELQEELGIEALSLSLYNTYSTYVDGAEWVGYFFLCDNYKGIPTLSEPEKHSEYRFLTAGELVGAGSTPENACACAIDLAAAV
jgi:mutator protein MutT